MTDTYYEWAWCDTHHKRAYISRSLARKTIRRLCDKTMRAYRCTAIDRHWHVGHLPRRVKLGIVTVAECYPQVAS